MRKIMCVCIPGGVSPESQKSDFAHTGAAAAKIDCGGKNSLANCSIHLWPSDTFITHRRAKSEGLEYGGEREREKKSGIIARRKLNVSAAFVGSHEPAGPVSGWVWVITPPAVNTANRSTECSLSRMGKTICWRRIEGKWSENYDSSRSPASDPDCGGRAIV